MNKHTGVSKAISVRQPWANAIIYEGKTIENRSWPTKLRGTVAIHAARALDDAAFFRFVQAGGLNQQVKLTQDLVKKLPRGAVIGVVDVIDCVKESSSPWFEGPYGFVLSNSRPLRPVPCMGALQFFDLPPSVVEDINRQLDIDRQQE
jgi:hypothetical protein